jgi:hypothetical protein
MPSKKKAQAHICFLDEKGEMIYNIAVDPDQLKGMFTPEAIAGDMLALARRDIDKIHARFVDEDRMALDVRGAVGRYNMIQRFCVCGKELSEHEGEGHAFKSQFDTYYKEYRARESDDK